MKVEIEPELENPNEQVEEEHVESEDNKKPMWDDGSNDEEDFKNSMDDEDNENDVNINAE